MRPEETRKYTEILWDFNTFHIRQFVDFIGNFQTFVQLGVRLGSLPMSWYRSRTSRRAPCRVGATWAQLRNVRSFEWRDDEMRFTLTNTKVDWRKSVDSGDWPWLQSHVGKDRRSVMRCSISFLALQHRISGFWNPGFVLRTLSVNGTWVNEHRLANGWVLSRVRHQLRHIRSDDCALPFWTFDLVFQWYFQCFYFLHLFFFECSFYVSMIVHVSRRPRALVKILFQTQVWE